MMHQVFFPINLTVPPPHAAYTVPIVPAGLEVRYANLNPAGGEAAALGRSTPQGSKLQETSGRPQTACRTAGEQRAHHAKLVGTVQVPDRVQRCSRCRVEGHNVCNRRALPPGLQVGFSLYGAGQQRGEYLGLKVNLKAITMLQPKSKTVVLHLVPVCSGAGCGAALRDVLFFTVWWWVFSVPSVVD